MAPVLVDAAHWVTVFNIMQIHDRPVHILLLKAGSVGMADAVDGDRRELALLIRDQHRIIYALSPIIVIVVVKVEILVLHCQVVFVHDVAGLEGLVVLLLEVTDEAMLVVRALGRHLHVLLMLLVHAPELILLLEAAAIGVIVITIFRPLEVPIVLTVSRGHMLGLVLAEIVKLLLKGVVLLILLMDEFVVRLRLVWHGWLLLLDQKLI